MKRRYRVLVSLAVVAGSGTALLLLSSLGVNSRGPLSGLIERLGAGVSALESAARRQFSGTTSRARQLAAFAPYRNDPDRLRRPDTLLFGAFESGLPSTLAGVGALESTLGVPLPIIQFYAAWGDKPEQQFPLRIVRAISDYGSVPMITWEPWLSDFDNSLHPTLPPRNVREQKGMRAVADGQYDFYLDKWAKAAVSFGKPLLVRLGHEMNDGYRYPWGPQNNERGEYIDAWQHVVGRFRDAGATNVLWVWSPHVAYEGWQLYYPGDEYVDWTATGALNYGPIAQWSSWWTFEEIFGKRYAELAAFGKPVMIAEFGSLSVGGDRAVWYRDALASLAVDYPAVKALLFFEVEGDRTITYQSLDWRVRTDSAVVAVVRAAGQSQPP